MTVRVLVVDDQPDVEPLLGQQFRREVRDGDADTVATALERDAEEFPTKPVDFAKLRRDIMAVKADAMRRNA